MIEKFWNQSLFLHEFNVEKSLTWFFYSLIKSILKSIRNIHNINNFGLESGIEHICLIQIVLEISATCKYKTRHITFVISNKSLNCHLTNFTQIVMTFLFSQTCKTNWWLTSFVMFLRQLDCKFIEYFLCITL